MIKNTPLSERNTRLNYVYNELRFQMRRRIYKTVPCRRELDGKTCIYGTRCSFLHKADRFTQISPHLYILSDTPRLVPKKKFQDKGLAVEGKRILSILNSHLPQLSADLMPIIAEYADKYISWHSPDPTNGAFYSSLPMYSLPDRFAIYLEDNKERRFMHFGFCDIGSRPFEYVNAYNGTTHYTRDFSKTDVRWSLAKIYEFEITPGQLRIWPTNFVELSVILRLNESYMAKSKDWNNLFFAVHFPDTSSNCLSNPNVFIPFVSPSN